MIISLNSRIELLHAVVLECSCVSFWNEICSLRRHKLIFTYICYSFVWYRLWPPICNHMLVIPKQTKVLENYWAHPLVTKNKETFLLIYGIMLSMTHSKDSVLFELGAMNVVACLCWQERCVNVILLFSFTSFLSANIYCVCMHWGVAASSFQ